MRGIILYQSPSIVCSEDKLDVNARGQLDGLGLKRNVGFLPAAAHVGHRCRRESGLVHPGRVL